MTVIPYDPIIVLSATKAHKLMIDLKNLKKTYHIGEDTVHALAGVSLQIEEGDFAAFVGPSGSGKSTLLHIIGGLDMASAGTTVVDGQDLSKATDTELSTYRNKNIGFVFQTFNLHPTYTALENVAIPLLFSGVGKKERLQRAKDALDSVGLSARANHHPNELSGGERQRVSIARALVVNPKVIIADEPTGNLDSKNGSIIMDLLQKLNGELGITLLIATHDSELAARAKRVVILKDGAITEDRRNQ